MRLVAGFVQPFTDGLDIEPCLGGNLTGNQIQFPAQTAHLMVGFKVDHFASPLFCRRLSTIALSDRPLTAGGSCPSELAGGCCCSLEGLEISGLRLELRPRVVRRLSSSPSRLRS